MRQKDVKFSLDSPLQEDGFFRGYAAIFEKADACGDIILPGAFAESLGEKDTIPILWSHAIDEPIGVAYCREDSRGLLVEAQLNLDVKRGREIRSLMKQGAIRALSIGYQALAEGRDKESGLRLLRKVKLWEISPCVFGAQGEATIEEVKSAGAHKDEYEGMTKIAIDGIIVKLAMLRLLLRANTLKYELEDIKSNFGG